MHRQRDGPSGRRSGRRCVPGRRGTLSKRRIEPAHFVSSRPSPASTCCAHTRGRTSCAERILVSSLRNSALAGQLTVAVGLAAQAVMRSRGRGDISLLAGRMCELCQRGANGQQCGRMPQEDSQTRLRTTLRLFRYTGNRDAVWFGFGDPPQGARRAPSDWTRPRLP